MNDRDLIRVAEYIDAREALILDRVERQIAEVAGKQARLERKVDAVTDQVRIKPHKEARR